MDYKLLANLFARYSKKHLHRSELDEIYLKNLLLRRFNEISDYVGEIDYNNVDNLLVPDYLIQELYTLLGKEDLLFATEILGLLTPSPSEVINKFFELKKSSSLEALNYLYDLQIKNNYIQKTAIDKNIKWDYFTHNNRLEITINLSKPEKNNKDIAKALTVKQENKYPSCLLCIENLGYGGNANHPARENIRIIPFKLDGDDFFMQYSPYCYYDQHCIVINKKHVPMSIHKKTFAHLLDFVDIFEEYFIGSNSDLPIVGGSILSHEHYQGGIHKLPIMYSKPRYTFYSKSKELKIEYLDWFNSCIKLSSKNKNAIFEAMEVVRTKWIAYSNSEIDIINFTNETRHNTITPIVKKENGEYTAYLILRNNRTNDIHPDGIFHAHKEYHNIKSEGIGLIEAMGLFILPGRLQRQCKEIENILLNGADENYYNEHNDMLIHKDFITRLQDTYKITKDNVKDVIKDAINDTCMHILENTAVFKNDELGNKSAIKFIESLDL